jgi:methyl-accepting chemotaxis protein
MTSAAEESLRRTEELLARLEQARAELEQLSESGDSERAIEVLQELAQIAREVETELGRARKQADAGT